MPVARERDVKAAFVYNFLKFVEWPAGRFGEINSPIVIGLVGDDPIAGALEATVHGRAINGRPLILQRVATPEAARTAHLLFFCAAEDERLNELLPALAGSGVLTVGESEAFAQQAGIITFALQSDKLRFDINTDSAERAGLKISAQLLKLARTVQRKRQGPDR
jgi:hypothetical protein